jgi:acetolactate synthase I/II/III large subunit
MAMNGAEIVVDESVSFGRDFYPRMQEAAPHDWLQLTGGPSATACPWRRGSRSPRPDGASWTQARETLDVTTVLLSNRKYQILFGELAGVGATAGPAASCLFDLGNPAIDWVRLAGGLGRSGPFLIELMI